MYPTDNTTTRFGLTLLAQYQAQKELTINENFQKIDLLLNRGVLSYTQDITKNLQYGDLIITNKIIEQPCAAARNDIILYVDEFIILKPINGMILWACYEKKLIVYSDTEWISVNQ